MRYVLVVALLFSSTVFAHSGRTDQSGCHYDRQTGVYHCH
ncbi:MAG: YHYH domain-containing protein [Chitinophaga sp.]|nr:YHYH domain-containing protein [Chitinophaga sp.]